jgi:aminoglycoside phosphotransferase
VPFCRRRPSALTLRWVERSLAGRARVVAWRRMTGGIGSVVHRLTIDHGSYPDVLVLRQHELANSDTAALVRHEAATLRAVHDTGLPAPEPIAADADGRESDGQPAILMTRLTGRLDVTPTDPEGWLRQIAVMAVRIHDVRVAAGPFRTRIDAAVPVIPASATRPAVWKAAFGILRQQAPEPATCFIHRASSTSICSGGAAG